MQKPLIVVTNDDGITSKGIRVLVEEMRTLGEVVVIAPDSPNSGMGHAITVSSTLHVRKSKVFEGIESYECSGTPADCVKLGKHHLLKGRKIDLLVSGINHGHNASISVIYSGTMSAAVEGAIEGIPSVGFSLDDFSYEADFNHVRPFLRQIATEVISGKLPAHVALNVNFPAKQAEPPQGIKLVRQANGFWKEIFDERKDPHGRPYYWLGGDFINREPQATDTDIWAIENNFVSIVPVQYDMTSYQAYKQLNSVFGDEPTAE